MIAKFIFNNIKNINVRYILFRLNCRYHLYISYKKDIKLYFKPKIADSSIKNLRNFINTYKKNY